MSAGSTSNNADGQRIYSGGLLDFGPVTTSHDDETPALIPLEDYPFSQLDWPTPIRKPYIITTVASRLVDDNDKAFNQLDWPNPAPARKLALTWINDNQNNVLIPTSSPFSQNDWPGPSPKKLKSETWIQNLLENTLAPAVDPVALLLSVQNVSLPYTRKPYIITEISSAINITPSEKPPLTYDYPNPPAKKKSALSWIQSRQFYYQDTKPFKQDNYPNPPGQKLKLPNTYILSRKLDEPAALYMPCSVLDWPNPAPKRKMALTWVNQISQLQQIFTTPIGVPFTNVPVLRIKPIPQTWIQSRPPYYTEPLVIPFNNIEWDMPVLRKSTLIISHVQRFTTTPTITNPFSQNNWPNPIHKQKISPQWEFFYQQDDNLPPVAQVTSIPVVRKSAVPLSWIFRSQIEEVQANPNRVFDYPNPIILKKQPLTWLVNLLQSTLTPPPAETPFNQTDYPNPLVGKRNFHSGWSQDRKFYYTEPPLMIAQYDWPVFRPVRRSHVGFIDYKIGVSEPPKIVQLTDVPPPRKVAVPLTWIYSLLPNLTPSIAAKPFSQNDWPNPIRIKTNYGIFTIIGQNIMILPNIVGREICLISSITEYYLISGIDEYDLESSITEYYLDSGGDECQ